MAARPLREWLLFAMLLSFGCQSTLAPTGDLEGTWTENFSIPGASLTLSLSQDGAQVTGSGTFSIEAGRSGTLQITGTYNRPSFNLLLRYDYGLVETFAGALLDATHISGTLFDNSGRTRSVIFRRASRS